MLPLLVLIERCVKLRKALDDRTAAALPDQHFDMVICNDVIEHMVDHDHFLEHIKTKMRPGACIVGSIPNVRHLTALFKLLVAKDWPYSASGILDRTHLRFFTENSTITHGVHREEGQGGAVCDGPSAYTFFTVCCVSVKTDAGPW